MSYPFAFSYCSWDSLVKNTEVVCYPFSEDIGENKILNYKDPDNVIKVGVQNTHEGFYLSGEYTLFFITVGKEERIWGKCGIKKMRETSYNSFNF